MMLNDADKAAVDKVCSQARSCTVIVVSGRPLQIDPAQLNETDALVAAWLPGSEGDGRERHAVRPQALHRQAAGHLAEDGRAGADQRRREGNGVNNTLFGRKPYTGKLPVTWPKTVSQEAINIGDANYHPLYPFGSDCGPASDRAGRGLPRGGRAPLAHPLADEAAEVPDEALVLVRRVGGAHGLEQQAVEVRRVIHSSTSSSTCERRLSTKSW